MNKKSKLILGFLALMLPFQLQAWADTVQGTITSIDSGSHSFALVPLHGDAQAAYVVRVTTAPGVRYMGVDSFDALQPGDYVEIQAGSGSKTGGSMEASQIERKFLAAQNVYAVAAFKVTQTTVTTTAEPIPALVTNSGTVTTTTTTPAVVQTIAPPVTTTYKSSETIKDGHRTSSEEKTTTTY